MRPSRSRSRVPMAGPGSTRSASSAASRPATAAFESRIVSSGIGLACSSGVSGSSRAASSAASTAPGVAARRALRRSRPRSTTSTVFDTPAPPTAPTAAAVSVRHARFAASGFSVAIPADTSVMPCCSASVAPSPRPPRTSGLRRLHSTTRLMMPFLICCAGTTRSVASPRKSTVPRTGPSQRPHWRPLSTASGSPSCSSSCVICSLASPAFSSVDSARPVSGAATGAAGPVATAAPFIAAAVGPTSPNTWPSAPDRKCPTSYRPSLFPSHSWRRSSTVGGRPAAAASLHSFICAPMSSMPYVCRPSPSICSFCCPPAWIAVWMSSSSIPGSGSSSGVGSRGDGSGGVHGWSKRGVVSMPAATSSGIDGSTCCQRVVSTGAGAGTGSGSRTPVRPRGPLSSGTRSGSWTSV